ncbi:hypothetical protein ACFQVA_19535 [Actinomadura keratinilytica]
MSTSLQPPAASTWRRHTPGTPSSTRAAPVPSASTGPGRKSR